VEKAVVYGGDFGEIDRILKFRFLNPLETVKGHPTVE